MFTAKRSQLPHDVKLNRQFLVDSASTTLSFYRCSCTFVVTAWFIINLFALYLYLERELSESLTTFLLLGISLMSEPWFVPNEVAR